MNTAASLPEVVTSHDVALPTAEQLPTDVATLQRMVLELLLTLRQERHDKEHLRARVHLLLQRLYGPKSERVNPQQLLLFAEELAAAANEGPAQQPAAPAEEPTAATSAGKRQARPHGRRLLPEHLPRRPVHHELSEVERLCLCGTLRVDIGTESGGEQLEWQPSSYYVVQHLIHKYLCPNCATQRVAASATASTPTPPAAAARDATLAASAGSAVPPTLSTDEGIPTSVAVSEPSSISVASLTVSSRSGPIIIAASKPPMPIDKGLPGPGLLAHIIVSKYFDHLPLYRQENISERQGVIIPRSTSSAWMAACAGLLQPLYQLMVTAVLESLWLHTDDTPVKNLGHAPGATDKGRFWIYYGDPNHPYNVFDFTVNRRRDGPQTFLADYQGYLHADAFGGYDALYLPTPRGDRPPLIEVACNAHARRKFHEARGSDAARAHEALAYYGQLYDLERVATASNFDDAQREQMRQELALPILDQFKAWLDRQRAAVLPKSAIAEAVGYALNHWSALIRYTEKGFLAIDNNVAEREMKRIAIGRKNWLFVGSENGGKTAAVLFSFTATCHRLKLDPWLYLEDVLTRLPRLDASQLGDLLPDRWQAGRQATASSHIQPDTHALP